MCHRCALVLSLPGFVCLFVCLFVCHASFFRISLRDLCRRLLARLTSATKFVYFENRYHESSSRGAPLRTVALHAMYDTVHRALINRYTHKTAILHLYSTLLSPALIDCNLLSFTARQKDPRFGSECERSPLNENFLQYLHTVLHISFEMACTVFRYR